MEKDFRGIKINCCTNCKIISLIKEGLPYKSDYYYYEIIKCLSKDNLNYLNGEYLGFDKKDIYR